MSSYRLASNHDFFVRDLIRDYCAVYRSLAEQNRRYQKDGSMSYSVLHSLIGESMRKGVFWRLKDTAHYLFRHTVQPNEGPDRDDHFENIGSFADWCIGYAFHECCKLREDAFQGQHYAIRLTQLAMSSTYMQEMSTPLMPLTDQTAESCKREMNRILHVLRSGMLLLLRFLPSASENCCLARWLATEQENVRQAFGHLYPGLVTALYGANPERMFTLAASDFLDCGRIDQAYDLLVRAREEGQIDADGLALLFTLDRRKRQGSEIPAF